MIQFYPHVIYTLYKNIPYLHLVALRSFLVKF